jgi:hypothetical protein
LDVVYRHLWTINRVGVRREDHPEFWLSLAISCLHGVVSTVRKIVIECVISTAVSLEPILDHISTAVQDLESLLISGQLIRNGYSFEQLLIIPSSTAI